MNGERVNDIIKQYNIALSHFTQGELRIALILLDNTIEQSLKLYLDVKIKMNFPRLLDLLKEKNANLLSTLEIKEFKMFHHTRNTFFHGINNEKLTHDIIKNFQSITCLLISRLFNRWVEDLSIEINGNIPIISEFRKILIKIEEAIILFYYNVSSAYDPAINPIEEGLLILRREEILQKESIDIFIKCSNINKNFKGKIEEVKDLKSLTHDLIKIDKAFVKKRKHFYEILDDYYANYGNDMY